MNWFLQLFRRRQLYGDLSLEIQEHLEERIAELVEGGMPKADAESLARREFGNVTLIQERGRDVWRWHPLETFVQDVLHSLRLMRRNPGFTVIAISSLALGIGANTALFSMLDALVLRDLPVPHPEQLVRVGAHIRGDSFAGLSLPMFEEIARDQRVFSTMFAWASDVVLTVEANGALSRADIWAAGGNFYSELGAVPEIGRLIAPGDVNLNFAAPAQVAVLGYGFWQRHYGGARDVVGKTIQIEGLPFTIIGVTRKGFTGIVTGVPPEITIPLTAWPVVLGHSDVQQYLLRPDSLWLEAAGRLKPEVTLNQASAQLDSIWPSIRQALAPGGKTPLETAHFLSLDLKIESGEKGGSFLRSRFVKPLYVLLAIAGVVLLVACVNLASLMLARAAARSYEMGVRVALGASRIRLTRQMLTESVTLSMAGAFGAFAFAWWGSRALSDFILGQTFIVPAELNVSPDWRILSFTAAVAILTSILFGWAPAWRAAREDPNRAIQQNMRTHPQNTGRLGKSLMIAQVALSLVLLVSAGLFIRTLQKLHSANPGFRTHGLLQVSLFPKPGGYKNVPWLSYERELIERVSNMPGVVSAALSHNGPGQPIEWTETARISGTSTGGIKTDLMMCMPGTLPILRIGLLRGRGFTWQDDDRAPRVAIVSEDFVSQLFPKGDALGRRVDITTQPEWQHLEIVGIASKASIYDLRKRHVPTIYLPATQYGDYMGYPRLLIETKTSPAAFGAPLRRVVESLGRDYIFQIKTIEQSIDRTLLQERVTAMLSAFFGGLALLLAAIGLYGLMAYNVKRRSREIGIRMALGAEPKLVRWMVLRETLVLAFIGLIAGLPAAAACSRLIAGMFYGVTTSDPVTLIGVSLLLLVVAALAGFIPARRAMRLDPIATLHYE